MLGLCFCVRAFSSCSEQGPLFIAVCGPLTFVVSLVAEHRLQTCRLSSCGSWAQPLRSMWDPPKPGLEPVSPALAGRFSTTVPPGKPAIGILTGIALNPYIALGSTLILTILIFLIQEYGVFFHLFASPSISFISVL